MTNSTATNKPIHSFRISPLKVAIWKNETESGPLYSVTFQRAYKTADGFSDTSSILARDLLLLAQLAEQADGYIESLDDVSDDRGTS